MKKGAEAEVWLDRWMGIECVFKIRKPRNYMIPQLDEKIRRQRTIMEAKMMSQARKAGVMTPAIFFVDIPNYTIIMEFVRGRTLKHILKEGDMVEQLCRDMGRTLAILHSVDIVHGDPTPSNFIPNGGRLYIFDFGLAYHSSDIEDKAVDIHVAKEVLSADLPERFEETYRSFIEGYHSFAGNSAEAIIERSKAIELRGRYARGQWG